MPTKPNTPQITTKAPRSLKEAWHKECVRLQYSIGLANQGNGVLNLIAEYLADRSDASRDKRMQRADDERVSSWPEDESSEAFPTTRSLQAKPGPAAGSDNIEAASRNRIASKVRLPKR